MKVLRKLLLVSLAGAMFAACSKDPETVDPIGPVAPEEGVEIAPVSVSLVVPGMTVPVTVLGAQTRAEGEEAVSVSVPQETEVTRAGDTSATAAESAIKNLWILQFNGNGNLAFKALFENVTESALSVSLLGFDKTTVYAIANVGKDKFANTAIGSLTLTQLEAMKFTAANGSVLSATDANPTIADGLPMIGSWTGQTKDPSIATGQPKIDLVRLVAKIVFTYSIDVPTGQSFWFTYFRMFSKSTETSYKAPAAGSIAPPATAKFVDEEYSWSNPGTDKTYTWYLCENLRGTNPAITTPADKGDAKAPEHSTYIEITGLYNDGTDEYEVIYHIYLGKNNTDDFNIQRNHKYTVHATIKGNNAADSRLIVATDLCKNPWSTAQVETANSYMVSKAGRTYKFKATVQGNGKKTSASSTGSQYAPEIKPVALSPKSVKVLWETTGSKKIIKDVFLKDGWVYLTTAGEIGDPVTEGNALIAVYASETPGTHTDVLWSWHIWSTSYVPSLASSNTHRTREITTTGYNKVPARNISVMNRNLGAANNEVGDVKSFGLLYQWGRKDPFVGSAATSGTTFVTTYPNNWPVVAATATTSASGSSDQDKSINYAIAHPTTFITQVNTTTYDWLNAPAIINQRDNLWGNPNGSTQTPNTDQGSKSIYDPCPPGWRVAPQDTWTMFTKSGINTSTSSDFNVSGGFNIGWKFYYETTGGGTTVYYPAAGYRHRETGALTAVGEGGWWWSSSSYSAGSHLAGDMGFITGGVYPLNADYRAYGLSVRCVQN